MRPDYRIMVDGRDFTANFRGRLARMRVTDESGTTSDALELHLADTDRALELPRTGAEIALDLGWQGSRLHRMGLYVVNDVGAGGPPQGVTLKAHAADMASSIRAARSRSFDQIAARDLVATIAGEHGLEPVVGADIGGHVWPHIDQTAESDLHLLTRLARDLDAVAKPTQGRLLFVTAGQEKSATGRDLAPVALRPPERDRPWELSKTERLRYRSVTAQYQTGDMGEPVTVTAGSGAPVQQLRRIYATQGEAQAAADARLRRHERGQGTGRLTYTGLPGIFAETPLDLIGFKSGLDGRWIAKRVEHTITGSDAWTTTLTVELGR